MSRCQVCNWCPDTDGIILLKDGRSNRMLAHDTCLDCAEAGGLTIDDFHKVTEASSLQTPLDEATEQIEDWATLGLSDPDTALLVNFEDSDETDDRIEP